MLIIKHNNNDYYDGVAGTTGIDKTIVYDRESKEIENKDIPVFFERKGYSSNRSKDSAFLNLGYYHLKKEHSLRYHYIHHFVIGFCGKLYVGWKLYSETKPNSKEYVSTITYNFDLIKSMIKDNSYYGNFSDNYNLVKNYDALEIFRKYKTPIFLYDNNYNPDYTIKYPKIIPKFFINPILRDYEFYKLFNTYQAFQEIQMFLGGVLGCGEKKIIEVEDKYKISQHGFDKFSFRKEKEIKK